jgi:hypothetical protein
VGLDSGCGIGPLSVIDFVMAVLELTNLGDRARWVTRDHQEGIRAVNERRRGDFKST